MTQHTESQALTATLDNILRQPRYHLLVRAGTQTVIWGPGSAALREFHKSLPTTQDRVLEALGTMREDASATTCELVTQVLARLTWLERELASLMVLMDVEAFQATLARGDPYVQQ